MAIVRMLEMIARNGSLEEQVNFLPRYYTIKHVLACPDECKQSILSKLKENHKNDNINTLDEDSELRLTIMSGIAQDELRKLSSRVKLA